MYRDLSIWHTIGTYYNGLCLNHSVNYLLFHCRVVYFNQLLGTSKSVDFWKSFLKIFHHFSVDFTHKSSWDCRSNRRVEAFFSEKEIAIRIRSNWLNSDSQLGMDNVVNKVCWTQQGVASLTVTAYSSWCHHFFKCQFTSSSSSFILSDTWSAALLTEWAWARVEWDS